MDTTKRGPGARTYLGVIDLGATASKRPVTGGGKQLLTPNPRPLAARAKPLDEAICLAGPSYFCPSFPHLPCGWLIGEKSPAQARVSQGVCSSL